MSAKETTKNTLESEHFPTLHPNCGTVCPLLWKSIIWRKLLRKIWRPTCSQRTRCSRTVHQWLFSFFLFEIAISMLLQHGYTRAPQIVIIITTVKEELLSRVSLKWTEDLRLTCNFWDHSYQDPISSRGEWQQPAATHLRSCRHCFVRKVGMGSRVHFFEGDSGMSLRIRGRMYELRIKLKPDSP